MLTSGIFEIDAVTAPRAMPHGGAFFVKGRSKTGNFNPPTPVSRLHLRSKTNPPTFLTLIEAIYGDGRWR
jgi:hypothetical protein